MSVQYTAIFHGYKNDNFQMKIFDIFFIFARSVDCGCTLEPPQRSGSNEYPRSMFWSGNKKNMYTRVNPTFSILKRGVRGCSLYGHVNLMASVKENVAACKAKRISNLKDIILIPFYCIGIGVLVNIHLRI